MARRSKNARAAANQRAYRARLKAKRAAVIDNAVAGPAVIDNAITQELADAQDVICQLIDRSTAQREEIELLQKSADALLELEVLKKQHAKAMSDWDAQIRDNEELHRGKSALIAQLRQQNQYLQNEISQLTAAPPEPIPQVNGGYHYQPAPQPEPQLPVNGELLQVQTDLAWLKRELRNTKARKAGSSWPSGGYRPPVMPASNPVPVPGDFKQPRPRHQTVAESIRFAIEDEKAKLKSGPRIT